MAARRLPKLLLVDAMSLLFRAYHSIPTRFAAVGPQGEREPTNAVYGFLAQLLRVVDDYDPTHVAIAFDSPGPTFRETIDTQYKANREEPPDDLRPQFGRARELVEALGMPDYALSGFEADDILGTIAQEAARNDFHVRIFSGDRDLFQLITSRINVFYPQPRNRPNQLYDRAAFIERWGVEPRYLVDIKALQGDSSDNISGVPGIGEKTAISLIREYRDLDGVLAAIDELPTRARNALSNPDNQELAHLGKRLATIRTDAPVEFDPQSARIWVNADPARVRALLDELGFQTIRQRLPFDLDLHTGGQMSLFGSERSEPDWRTVDEPGLARSMVADLASGEAPSLFGLIRGGPAKLELCGLAVSRQGESWWIPDPIGLLDELGPWLADPESPKSAYASKELGRALAAAGAELGGVEFDAEIAAHLASGGENFAGLRQLVARNLDQISSQSVPDNDGIADSAESLPGEPVRAAQAVDRIRERIWPQLRGLELEDAYRRIELPLVPVLARMEDRGVAMDPEVLDGLAERIGKESDDLVAAVHEAAGEEFNLNSTRALSQVLYEKLGLPVLEKTGSGAPSTARRALERLSELPQPHPIVELIKQYRELSTLLRSYLRPLPKLVSADGRIHPRYSQIGSVTGRVATRNPNLQATPVRSRRGREIRHAFGAAPGRVLISADYSQIDLRVLAHISGDKNLIAAFRDDLDIHTATAAQLFGTGLEEVTGRMREQAKTVNFGIVYGITAHGLSWRSDLDLEGSAALINSYFARYPGVKAYMDNTKEQAHRDGFTRTLGGRLRRHHDLAIRGNRRQAAEREAINMPIQGTSAEIMKLAMIDLDRHIVEHRIPAEITLQIHDELLIEVDPRALDEFTPALVEIMNSAMELRVPLKTDVAVGPNWAETEPLPAG